MITLVKKQDPCQYDPLDALEDKEDANPSPCFLVVVEDEGCMGASRAMSHGHGPAQSREGKLNAQGSRGSAGVGGMNVIH
jgi:hypothetical protein